MILNKEVKTLISIIQNKELSTEERIDAIHKLHDLNFKNELNNKISREYFRVLMDIAKNEKEPDEIRAEILDFLTDIVENSIKLNVITDDDIVALIKTAKNENENEEVRESSLNMLSRLVENGRGMDIIRIFLNIVKDEIENARKKRILQRNPLLLIGIPLKVAEAPQMDIGLGRARIDVKSRSALEIDVGDVIEIKGKRKTAARVFRAMQEDEGKGIIRIDEFIRRNAKVSVGDKVRIRKVEPVDAKKVVIGPIIAKNQRLKFGEGIEQYIKKSLLLRPIVEGDEIVVPGVTLMGRTGIIFKVIKCIPSSGVLQIGMNTEIEVKERGVLEDVDYEERI